MTGPLERSAFRVDVASSGGSYPVLVERGLRHRIPSILGEVMPAFRYALIADSTVAPLYGEPLLETCRAGGLEADLFTFSAGEEHKTRKHWSILTDQLLAAGLGRDAGVVAVGGGVTGDLAGFVAATFLRGIPVVQVPTSMVAMIDASVGGKTGVDVRAGKNLVGAFHPPRAVVADPEVVATLPRAERAQGLAEAVKHGAIADAAYLERLEKDAPALLDGEPGATTRAVSASVTLKADVVSRDEREGGLREILNFGHTFGHALEAASGYAMGHGSAVAAGMVLESRLGERLGITRSGTAERLREALHRFGLGRLSVPTSTVDDVLRYLGRDKKVRGGIPRFVLLECVGRVARAEGWSHRVPEGVMEAVLAEEQGA